MIRRLKMIFVWVLFVASISIIGLWWIPKGDAPLRGVAVAQEEGRKNLYAFWDSKHFHFRQFRPGVHVVPHRFYILLSWGIFTRHADTIALSYRPFVEKIPTPRLYWSFPSFRAFRDSFDAEEPFSAQADYTLEFPIWSLLLVCGWYPTIVFLRGPIRRHWRRRRGRCASCGYDLRGAVSDHCSECGQALNARVREILSKQRPEDREEKPEQTAT